MKLTKKLDWMDQNVAPRHFTKLKQLGQCWTWLQAPL